MTDVQTTREDLLSRIDQVADGCRTALAAAHDADGVEAARVEYLGRKGALAGLMSAMAGLGPEDKPVIGQRVNAVKTELNALLDKRLAELAAQAKDARIAAFDPTMPGRAPYVGSLHPVTQAMHEVVRFLETLGFEVNTGPEIETDWHCFEALNIPPEHPARDMQDTLYINDCVVLRTHTSPIQVRTMLEHEPPIAVIAPGKVYRRDSDLTHTPMFHQIEGLLVDTDVTMADLRGTLGSLARHLFGDDTQIRFRQSFFPFTEPSAEVDISCVFCHGEGAVGDAPCRVCKQTGWLEILGCGMVDPNVFTQVGIDPEKYSGFAFGMGVERIAMLKYAIGDLRMFFENDVRFLKQFP